MQPVSGSSPSMQPAGEESGRERRQRKTQSVRASLQEVPTSDQAANPQPVHKDIVNEFAACEQLSDHVQVGSDCSGCIEHGLDHTTQNGAVSTEGQSTTRRTWLT